MSSNHARKMAELKIEFLRRTSEDIRQLERAREDAGLRTSRELRTLVHRLAGVTGMFGYETVSELATALEDALATNAESEVAEKLGSLITAVKVMLKDVA